MTCPKYACMICGVCKTPPTSGAASKTPVATGPDYSNPKGVSQFPSLADSLIIYVLGTVKEGVANIRRLDLYSGVNGYHIRTVPAMERWRNPVLVGAGCGYLAVVDRFNDKDLIRITDKYAGAGADSFDAEGFPKPDVDWEDIEDLYQIETPAGTHCVGVTILPTGVLIATLNGDSDNRILKSPIKALIEGTPHEDVFNGVMKIADDHYNTFQFVGQPVLKEVDIAEGMHQFVSAVKEPSNNYTGIGFFDVVTGEVRGFHALPGDLDIISVGYCSRVATAALGRDGKITKIMRFFIENPDLHLMSTSDSAKATPEPEEYTVTAFPAYRNYKDESDATPDMNEGKVVKYWRNASAFSEFWKNDEERLDVPSSLPDGTLRTFQYPQSVSDLNDGRTQSPASYDTSAYSGFKVEVVEISVPENVQGVALTSGWGVIAELFNRKNVDLTRMDPREPVFRIVEASGYNFVLDGGFTYGSVPRNGGDVRPTTNGMLGTSIAIDKSYEPGTLKTRDLKVALIDKETGQCVYWGGKPLYMSTGTFARIYAGNYAALQPYDVGFSQEKEDLLKQNRDLEAKAAMLADDTTLTDSEKSAKYDQYTSQIAENQDRIEFLSSLMTEDSSSVQRTSASEDVDATATQIDGIERPDRVAKRQDEDPENPPAPGTIMDPVDAWYTEDDCDRPWSCFIRRPWASQKVTVQAAQKSWTMREPVSLDNLWAAPPFLPEYMQDTAPVAMESPVVIKLVPNDPKSAVLCDPYGDFSDDFGFEALASGGFFVPNWATERTSTYAEIRADIQELRDLIANIDTKIARYEEIQPPPAEITEAINQLQAQREKQLERIEQLENRMAEVDDEVEYRIPRSLTRRQINNIDLSPGQEVVYDESEGSSYDSEVVGRVGDPGDMLDTYPVGEDDERIRGVTFDTNVRTWIALDYRLERWGYFVDGKNAWATPEGRVNGLGVQVGSMEVNDNDAYAQAFNISGGNVYQYGYRSFWDEGGAIGMWEITFELDCGDYGVGPIEDFIERGEAGRLSYWHIFYNAPEEIRDKLLAAYGNIGHGIITPGRGIKGGLGYWCKHKVESVNITCRLYNYAFDVYRNGWRTLYFDDCKGNDPNCPCTDPGYVAGDNCEAAGCGNLTCGSRVFGARNKLYQSDSSYDTTRQLVWEQSIGFSMGEDPYEDAGIFMGRFFDCYVDFDLGAPMTSFDINISQGAMSGGE